MSPASQGGLFLLHFVAGLIVFVLLLRFFMRATYVDWRHPVVTFIAKITNPLVAPMNKLIPVRGRWDYAALATAFLVQVLFVWLLGWLSDREYDVGLMVIVGITEILNQMLDIMFWLIIIQVILSWVSQGYNPNTAIIDQMTSPILRPFQRIIPPIAGLDLSPIVAILAIKLVQIVVVGSIAQYGQSLVS